jgi:hypothetical protein
MKTREQERTDAIIGGLSCVAVGVLLFLALVIGTSRMPDEDPNARPTTTTVSTVPPQEDEAGWDCRIHGNLRCD